MSVQLITASYNDAITVNFTTDAWFNATAVAKHFKKKANEWLRLESTKEYIACLQEMTMRENPASVQNQLVKTEKGGKTGGGGSWFHPKLAVAFARWLDVKFAIWCDMQIEKLLHPVQYGLKALPPSPYISEAEAARFKKSLEAHCQGNRQQYSQLYRKVYDYFGITTYTHIPSGKLDNAARVCGIKLVAVKKPVLPPEPFKLSLTPEELEDLVAERIKQVQGELVQQSVEMPKPSNSITISLNVSSENPVSYLLTQMPTGTLMMWNVDSNGRQIMTDDDCAAQLRRSHHVVVKKAEVVGKLEA